jgi:hypothetical protein
MPMYVEIRDDEGRVIRGLPDPSGGTFDAAGDFDRFFDESYPGHRRDLHLGTLGAVDPYATTEMGPDGMCALLSDIELALSATKAGPERRGLLRLQVMAETCAELPGSTMTWIGD